MQVLRIGPLNLPLWILISAGGLVVLVAVRCIALAADRPVWTRTDDLLLTSGMIGFAAWKLMPLLTRTAEIVDSPLRLLYYPGGLAGIIAGVVLAAGSGVIIALRGREREPLTRRHGLHAVLLVGALLLGPIVLLGMRSISSGPRYEIAAVELSGLSGPVQLSEDTPTVLVFWATWCGPCTAQMPELERFWAGIDPDNANVVAVNLIETEAGQAVVQKYMDDGGFTFPVGLDSGGVLAARLDVRATPTTIMLDADGAERYRRTGAISGANLAARLLPLRQ